MTRPPAVAGTFYAGEKEQLLKQIEGCFKSKFGPGSLPTAQSPQPKAVYAGVVPHAGYMYSGPFAVHFYSKLKTQDSKPKTFIILGPNHTGIGAPVSISAEGNWATPLGQAEIDSDLAKKIVSSLDFAMADDTAHLQEHSIEVQLPFLQYVLGPKKDAFKFIPICMMSQDKLTAEAIGHVIAKFAKKENVVLIASSDFTHYEPAAFAGKKDKKAIDAICNLDVELFYNTIQKESITACGFGPIAAIMIYAKEIGLKKGELLKYGDSGDITGDKSSVVGYASIIFK